MERPPKKYVCEKCGYLGNTSEHEGCDYLAWTTGEQRYIDHLEAELAALRASPASAPEGFKHGIGADRFTTVRGTYWWHVRAGDGTQNIGKFHTKLAAEDMARALLTAFRDGAFMQYQAMLGSAPTPPVSENRKDAERYRVLKSGDFSVEQFVSSSYGWKFVPMEELDAAIDAAMQEDKL